MLFDIGWLISNWDLFGVSVDPLKFTQQRPHLCQPRKIDQCQTQNMGRVDFEVDRLAVDALVVSSYSGRLILNLSLDILKLSKSSVRYVMELSPFWLCCYRGCGMGL